LTDCTHFDLIAHLMFQQNYNSQGYTPQQEPLAFFGGGGAGGASSSNSPYYSGSRSSLEGNMGGGAYGAASGSMSGARLGSMMAGEGRWWEAFGTGGFEGEPSLAEGELSAADVCIWS
jgi:hypothetical protein